MFTKKTRFADMFSTNNHLVLLMPRLGISLGVGDKTVQEVCDSSGVASDFVLMVCNMYTYRNYEPDTDCLLNTDMSMLVPYLRASHTYYINERMPHLERHLASVARQADERSASALVEFFGQYRNEMSEHFAYEEKVVYPLLQNAMRGRVVKSDKKLVKAHLNMVDKISDLLQILYKYLPSKASTEELNELIFGLLQLSSDFERHAAIEEHVLMPYIEMLERRSVEDQD